jgi:ketosteroid isomerase-like protein
VRSAEPAVDERTAEKDAKGLVLEIYQTIGRAKTDSMFSLLADPLTVFGPRRADATATRADALVALGKVVDPKAKKHAQLRSGGLAVVVSQGGRSAWAFDLVNVDGRLVAATAVLSNTGDLWSVTAATLAAVPTAKQVKAESARDAVVPPGASAAARVDPAAAPIVAQFKRGLVDLDVWGEDLVSQSDAIVAGATVGQIARGKQEIKQLWRSRRKANVRAAVSGEVSAAVTADGQLAWLSSPITRVADGDDPLPLRVFAIYQKDGAAWRMIALHEALAIDQPGSGTAFKKILPAAPAPAEPAKASPADKPADATAKAKTKKKRKRARAAPDTSSR